MTAEVYGSWCQVDVHEVVDNSALNVVLNPIDQESIAHVKDLYVGEFPGQSHSDEQGKYDFVRR